MVAPATITLFDNIYDDKGAALVATTVTCVLDSTVETTSGGLIAPLGQSTTTDGNGRFAFTLVCNDLLSPANSTYTISIPSLGRSYQIAPQSANGSSQQSTAANVIVNAPQSLANVMGAGPITVTPGPLTIATVGLILSAGVITETGGVQFADPADTTKILALLLSGMTAGAKLTLASSQATSQTLTVPTIRQAEALAVKPQIYQASPSNPAGTASTTGVMMGLAGAITPQVTGRILLMLAGDVVNNTAATGAKMQLYTGTGTAPINGAALTGTTAGGLVQMVFGAPVSLRFTAPFALHAIVSGLALGTAVWLDASLAAISGGTATMADLSLTAFEL